MPAHRRHRRPVLSVVVFLSVSLVLSAVPAGATSDGVWFPVQLPLDSYADTWGAPRGGGRSHEGTDILAPQMREVYAAVGGEIIKAKGEDCPVGAPCDSYYLAVAGDDGRGYFYVHLNNDTPDRPNGCDGLGGVEHAFSPRLVRELADRGTLAGVRVDRGEHIGWIGSSGNAACGIDQLHFEIWNDRDWGVTGKTNPYPELSAAEDAGRTTGSGGVDQAVMHRDAGDDRIGTAAALSADGFPTARTVVVARADRYTDALVAAPLAAALDGPVLLSPARGGLPDALASELERLDPRDAVVIGDVAPEVVAELSATADLAPDRIIRITGDDQYELSARVADAVVAAGGDASGVLLAAGEGRTAGGGWPDALMASLLGAYRRTPVLLTRPDELPTVVANAIDRIGPARVDVVGGIMAVDPQVEARLADTVTTMRLAGPSRLETALVVADALLDEGQADDGVLHLATASDYPDALAAGPALVASGSVMVLMDAVDRSRPVLDWVDARDGIEEVHAIGGVAALPDEAVRAVIDRAR